MKEKMRELYCLNDFYVRYPYLSYDFYSENLRENPSLNYIEQTKLFLIENILVASPSLYQTLVKEINSKTKEISCYKYLLRSSLRCTPYGLNAGVAIGRFSKLSDSTLLLNNHKLLRVDLEWLVSSILKLEKQAGYRLKIKCVDCLQQDYLKIKSLWNSCFCKNNDYNDRINIVNNTDLIKLIIKETQSYKTISQIIKSIVKKKDYEESKLYDVLIVLLENGILTSDLRVSLLSDDPYKELLSKISMDKVNADILKPYYKIEELINVFNSEEIGEGIETYLSIVDTMEEISKVDNYLQAELYNDSEIILNEEIKPQIDEFANFLLKWSNFETLNDYVSSFREKYGEQSVKMLDVIDENIGIGMPYPDNENSDRYHNEFISAFLCELLNSYSKGEYRIDLSKSSFFNNRKPNMIKSNFPLSAELSFFVLKNKQGYRCVLSPMMGSEEKWKSFGRFEHLFKDKVVNHDNFKSKGFQEVELTFYPQVAHYANVVINQTQKDAYTEISEHNLIFGKERIDINDIYLFVDKESKLAFVNKKNGSILDFTLSNKIVPRIFPKIYQAINTIKVNQKPSIENLLFVMKNELNKIYGHIPEICYKNIILFPESWRLPKENIIKNGKIIAFDDFKAYVKDMVAKKKLPLYIFTGPMDHKIILCLNTENDLKLLYKSLKKDNDLVLEKVYFNNDNLMLKDSFGHKYIGEFVFQLSEKNFESKETKFSPDRIPFIDNDIIMENNKLPFKEWVTLKLYIRKENEDKILISQIRALHDELKKCNAISQFHYLRYTDQYNHLRIRFRINDGKQTVVLEKCQNLINILDSAKLLNNAVYDSYLPEINRYGGKECIENAEELFYYNSILAIDLNSYILNKLISFNKEEIFILSCYKIIKDMGIDNEEALSYIERYKLNHNNDKEFKKYNDRLGYFFLSNLFEKNFLLDSENINLLVTLEKGTGACRDYWNSVVNKYKDDSFSSFIKKRYCFVSVLHMFHNRFVGRKNDNEDKLLGLLRKFIYIRIQSDKYEKK